MINLTEQIDAIKMKYDPWWNDKDCEREVAALHGAEMPPEPTDYGDDARLDGMPNYCGVFTKGKPVLIHNERDYIEIRTSQTPKGHWLVAMSYQCFNSSGGSMPSIWNHEAFESRDEAINFGIDVMLKKMDGYINGTSCSSEEGYKKHGSALKNAILDWRNSKNQLTLF